MEYLSDKSRLLKAVHNYRICRNLGYHFESFEILEDKYKQRILKYVAIGEDPKNIVAVLNTGIFNIYKKGFAITPDRLYFSKDFRNECDHSKRYVEIGRHVQRITDRGDSIIIGHSNGHDILHSYEYTQEILNLLLEYMNFLQI